MVSVGDVLDDFQIVRELARSGMATVFKAHQRCTGRTVVLKIPHLEFESDVVFSSRFQREEQIGLRLHHPAIAQTLSVSGKSRPYLAMEYIEGTSLHHVMRDEGPLPLDRSLTIARDVCSALVHMHALGIVHRDIKPENLLLDAHGGIHIVDFGIALDYAARRLTWGQLSNRLGTPDYMSPERMRGGRGDARSDMYSLGVLLYEMISGRMPFESPAPFGFARRKIAPRPLQELAPQIDRNVVDIVSYAMAFDPRDRFPAAAAMLAALEDPSSAAWREVLVRERGDRKARARARATAYWSTVAIALSGLAWLVAHGH